MLVSAAILPQPPALVPELASGAAGELESVRAACAAAIDQVMLAGPDLVLLVGVGPERASFGPGAAGSFAGFGVPVQSALPGEAPDLSASLPLSLTVGAWLMQGQGDWPRVRGEAVPPTIAQSEAAQLGAHWAAATDRTAIIAMGDGSAALTQKAPGYQVDGAQLWQKAVTKALADVELDVIDGVGAADAATFLAGGRPVWQVLAGAARETASRAGGWRGQLLVDEAPYGVAYVVATWMWESA